MTIRDRLTDIIGGKQLAAERRKVKEGIDLLYDAYLDGKYIITPQKLADRIGELDYNTLSYLIQQKMGSLGTMGLGDMEQQRLYQLNDSRWQWYYSPLAQWSVNVWTSFGLGDKVTVVLNDENAQELWDDTWTNNSIFDDDEIQNLSNFVCVEGEMYLAAFIDIAHGAVTFERVDVDEIKAIITHPENANEPLYYKREYVDKDMQTKTMYYPDWHTFFYKPDDLTRENAGLDAEATITVAEAITENNGTTALIFHIAHNRKDPKSLHGWPILGIAAPYLRAHKEFMESRLAVARQVASFVREEIVAGGSRAVSAVTARFNSQLGSATSTTGYVDSNPPALPGSTYVHNQAVEHKDMPLTTGAGDADTDNKGFAWMALIGAGLFPTSAGLDTSRWATAVAMDKTQAAQWQRYQTFWAAQFRKMVELVLSASEKWDHKKWEDKGCTVSIDTLSLVDFPGVVEPIAQMLTAINTLTGSKVIPEQAARKIAQAYIRPTLQALSTENLDETLDDDIMEILTDAQRKKKRKEDEEAAKKLTAQLSKTPTEPDPNAPPEDEPPADGEQPTQPAKEYYGGMANLALKIYEDNRKNGHGKS